MQNPAIVRIRKFRGGSFLLADSPKPEKCGMHSHDCVLVSYLLKGRIIEVDQNGRRVDCHAPTLHMTAIGEQHAHLIQSPRVTTLCFTLDQAMLPALEPAFAFDCSLTIKRGPAIMLAPKFVREMTATDTASELVITGLIFELAGLISRKRDIKTATGIPPWLKKAKEMLHDLQSSSLAIEDIAKEVGVAPSHLSRSFRKHLKQSPGEYQRQIRMEFATREVISSSDTLKEIAIRSGFADQAHFSREFRRLHGVAPAEMRRRMQPDADQNRRAS